VRSYSFSVWRWSQPNRHHAAPSKPSLHISCSVPLAGSKSRGAPTLQGLLHSEELDEQLIEQFRVASSLRDWPAYTEEHAFVNVLLDAAIESGTMIPSPLLEPFEGKWTDAKREPNCQRPLSESRRPYKPWVSRRDIEQSISNSVNSSTSKLGRVIWLPETGCWSQHQSKYRIGPEVEVTQCTPTRCGLA
jgi:hypothetical protein